MFGFGPDMYFYSYPISSRPLHQVRTTSHAHNYPLQVLMEQGLAGLALFLTTAILVFITAISVIRRVAKRRDEDQWLSILMAGLLAALIARAIEQAPGVGRVSDLVTFWALMGLVIAVAEIEFGPATRRRALGPLSFSGAGFRRLAPFGAAILAGVVALTIFVQKDVNNLRAGVISANGFEHKNAGENDDAFRSFQEAVSLAPDVERYYTEVSGFLNRTAAANVVDDPARARELYTAARDLLLQYEERDPSAWQTQLGIATATAGLAGLGDETLLPEVVGRYLNIAALMKPFSSIQATAAENIVIAGEYEIGAAIAEHAIALEGRTGPVPTAWWALGEAAFQLDRLEDAELAWETSLKRQGRGVYAARSHRGLAFIAEARGDEELAAEHHSLADGLELELQ
jgi:tetratricopeptide (TPR) repeat protein